MIVPVIAIARREPLDLAVPQLLCTVAVMQQIPLTRVSDCLGAFYGGDWGQVSPDQAAANDRSHAEGGRILAIYPIRYGTFCRGRHEQILITRSSDALVYNVMLGTEYLG